MKKSIVILLVILSNNLSFSQIKQGSWILGGSINTNNNNQKINTINFQSTNSSSSTFNFIPELNYTINNKIMIGGGVSYSSTTSDFKSIFAPQFSMTSSSFSSKNEGFSGFIQAKYFVSISKNILWNLNLKSGFGKINYSVNSFPTSLGSSQASTFTIPDSPIYSPLEPTFFYSNINSQILFIPFQHFGFQLDIGGLNFLKYNYDKVANADISSNNVSFNINPSNWSLGVFYIFGKQTN